MSKAWTKTRLILYTTKLKNILPLLLSKANLKLDTDTMSFTNFLKNEFIRIFVVTLHLIAQHL